jgi:hypothetical protein
LNLASTYGAPTTVFEIAILTREPDKKGGALFFIFYF